MQTKFPDVSKAEWLAKVEKDLKGKPLDSLNWEVEREVYSPFWHWEDQKKFHPVSRVNSGWRIGVVISKQDVKEANDLALEALAGGAEAIWFNRRHALSKKEKEALLAGIFLEIVEITIDEEETKQGTGNLAMDLMHAAKRPDLIPSFFPRQQSGFFESIANYRAVRLCWQLIVDSYGLATPCKVTAFLFPDGNDVNRNKITSTSHAMAAAIGGVDTIYLLPADAEVSSSFERRIARNIQHILREESYLERVADPAAGSYYIESLTNTIAEKIWTEFQQISKRG